HTRFSRDWSSDVCSSDLFTIQDYSGSYEFFISGKNFLNNQGLIESGNFLHLVVSFSEGYNGELRHSVDAINLLREIAGKSIEAEIGRASCRESERSVVVE